jgi:hypothetical protein
VNGKPYLFEIVAALGTTSSLACGLNRRQQQGNKDPNDRNHDQ